MTAIPVLAGVFNAGTLPTRNQLGTTRGSGGTGGTGGLRLPCNRGVAVRDGAPIAQHSALRRHFVGDLVSLVFANVQGTLAGSSGRAGLPTTFMLAGTGLLTTLPAPTIELSPTSLKTTQFVPIQQLRPILI